MKGEILFSIQTFMGARLLQHMSDAGICVHDVSAPDEHTLNVWIPARDEKAFLTLMESFHLPCRLVSVRGRAKIIRSLKKHAVLTAGIFAGIFLVYMLSLRVWRIDLDQPPDGMRESLERISVSEGMKKSCVDVNALSRQLEAEYPEYAHIGVRLSGVVLKIVCVKAEAAPEVYDIGNSRSLVAKTDGVIEKIDVFAGRALVKPGDTVFKGDLLILGEERAGKNGETTTVRAQGSVIARVWTKGESKVSRVFSKTVPTGRISVVSEIRAPYFTKTLSGENPFDVYDQKDRVFEIGGLFFPVKLVKTEYYEMKTENASITEDAAKQIAFENALAAALQKAPEGAEEARRWVEYKDYGNTIACTAVVEWTMDIAADG